MENSLMNRQDNGMAQQMMPSAMATQTMNSAQLATNAREIARIQGEIFMAKQFPRNYQQALVNIQAVCSRPSLANAAVYQYAKGGTQVYGPSIRLAEQLARCWGNVRSGWETQEDLPDHCVVRTYAYDVETNVQAERIFTVPMVRHTRQGDTRLTDPRDRYEMCANQAARRLRACILEVLPVDIVDYAVDQCKKTIESNVTITPETGTQMVAAFQKFGVNKAQIEALIQRHLDALDARSYLRLQTIWTSLSDGTGKPEDFFDMSIVEEKPKVEHAAQTKLRQSLRRNAQPKTEAAEPPQPKPQTQPDPVKAEPAPQAKAADNGASGLDSFDDDPLPGEENGDPMDSFGF